MSGERIIDITDRLRAMPDSGIKDLQNIRRFELDSSAEAGSGKNGKRQITGDHPLVAQLRDLGYRVKYNKSSGAPTCVVVHDASEREGASIEDDFYRIAGQYELKYYSAEIDPMDRLEILSMD